MQESTDGQQRIPQTAQKTFLGRRQLLDDPSNVRRTDGFVRIPISYISVYPFHHFAPFHSQSNYNTPFRALFRFDFDFLVGIRLCSWLLTSQFYTLPKALVLTLFSVITTNFLHVLMHFFPHKQLPICYCFSLPLF